jgi:dTDP-4-amino-4,6-dideoxygalactose transaminase
MVQFIDLAAQQRRIRDKIMANIEKTLEHCQFILGPEVRQLEQRLAEFVGARHAVSCSSGTDALLMALMARGIGPGDAVLTTPFTFVATAEVISILGATPVFVDIEPETFAIDPDKLEQAVTTLIEQDGKGYPLPRLPAGPPSSTLKPRALIAVDMFGLAADYARIEPICAANGLFLIEDAAQSFGAEFRGRKACAFGDLACTSFFPSKPLGGYGDGGMCFTDDDQAAEVLHSIRVHGQGASRYEHVRLGLNGRLDTLQAAVLLAKLDIFAEELDLRQKVADRYTELLARLPGIRVPIVPPGMKSAWAQYSLLAESGAHRNRLMERLKQSGIPAVVYYPIPLHLQPAFAMLGYRKGDLPVCEDISQRIFSLPMHPYLSVAEQESIAAALRG